MTRSITFLMNENWLLGGRDMPQRVALCNHFLNVVLFRDPIARIISHINYMQAVKSKMPSDVLSFVELAPIITNNYYVRVLLGENTYRRPMMNITEADLSMALHILDTFDIIMVLETLDLQGPIIIRRGFGWEKNKVLSMNSRRNPRQGPSTDHLSDVEKQILRERNELDYRLYRHAAEKAELDYEFFRQVQYISERGKQLVSDSPHWKAFPSLYDNSIHCAQTCGYICHIRLSSS